MNLYIYTRFSSRSENMVPLSFTSGIFVQLNDFKGCEGFGSFDFFLLNNGGKPIPKKKNINFSKI